MRDKYHRPDDTWTYVGSERTRLAFVVDPSLKEKAEQIAESESRTLSGWLRKEVGGIVANHPLTKESKDEISDRP